MNIPQGQTPDSRTDIEDLVVGLTDPVRVASDVSCAAMGDGNADGVVEFADFAAIQSCYTGPGPASLFRYESQCRGLDFNTDGDIDGHDYAAYFDAASP